MTTIHAAAHADEPANRPSAHRRRRASATAAAGLLALGLSACNGLRHPEDFPTDGPSLKATSNPAQVKASDFGHAWNLKVDHGTVTCKMNGKGDPALTFTAPNGTVYAINYVDANKGLPDIDKISTGSVGVLRSFAFTVCDAK